MSETIQQSRTTVVHYIFATAMALAVVACEDSSVIEADPAPLVESEPVEQMVNPSDALVTERLSQLSEESVMVVAVADYPLRYVPDATAPPIQIQRYAGPTTEYRLHSGRQLRARLPSQATDTEGGWALVSMGRRCVTADTSGSGCAELVSEAWIPSSNLVPISQILDPGNRVQNWNGANRLEPDTGDAVYDMFVDQDGACRLVPQGHDPEMVGQVYQLDRFVFCYPTEFSLPMWSNGYLMVIDPAGRLCNPISSTCSDIPDAVLEDFSPGKRLIAAWTPVLANPTTHASPLFPVDQALNPNMPLELSVGLEVDVLIPASGHAANPLWIKVLLPIGACPTPACSPRSRTYEGWIPVSASLKRGRFQYSAEPQVAWSWPTDLSFRYAEVTVRSDGSCAYIRNDQLLEGQMYRYGDLFNCLVPELHRSKSHLFSIRGDGTVCDVGFAEHRNRFECQAPVDAVQ
jgi:hypothetical protein